MKTAPLLMLAGLAANALAFDLLPPPSRVPTSRKDFLFDVAMDGFRKFVAVGESSQPLRLGQFYMDYKGDWTVDSAHPDGGDAMDPMYYGIARSKTRFVAVGGHNLRFKDPARDFPMISVSDDAVSWQSSPGPAKGVLWGVATDGEDKWVAVGSQQILLSEDGAKSWKLSTDQTGGETHAVHHGGADWMTATLVSGVGTRFHVSAFGKIWSKSSDFPGIQITSLAEDQGTWIGVGRYTAGSSRACIVRSTNQGATWEEVGPSLVGPVLDDVTWGEKTGFVAVGRDGRDALALWSRDGKSWQKIYSSFYGHIRGVQLWESPTQQSANGTTEIVMVGDTGAVWLDTLEFDTRRSTSALRQASRPSGEWRQIGGRLEVPQWVSGNVQWTVLSLDGRVESSNSIYLGSSRSIDLPRSWGPKVLRIRDEAGNVHVQKLSPTVPLF